MRNLAAFCLADGSLLASFVADFAGTAQMSSNKPTQVWALTTDGTSLFVGGNFSSVNGQPVQPLVKLNPITGDQVPGFNLPAIPDLVYALDYSGGKVYAGGDFAINNGATGKKGASFDHGSGAYAGWNPNADARIESLKVSPDGQWVFIGGSFDNVGNAPHDRFARTSAGDGAVSAINYGVIGARVFSVAVAPDSVSAYASTGPAVPVGSQGGNKVLAFNANGTVRWDQGGPDGDAQTLQLDGGSIYVGFHQGWSGDGSKRLQRLNTSNGQTTQPSFAPNSNGAPLGVRGLTAGANRLVAVGDFTTMGSTKKLHGLAIFP